MIPSAPEAASQKFNDPKGVDKTFKGYEYKTLKEVKSEGKNSPMDIPDDMFFDEGFDLNDWTEPVNTKEKSNNGKKPGNDEGKTAYAGTLVGTSTEVYWNNSLFGQAVTQLADDLSWKPLVVNTADDYKLTVFTFTGDKFGNKVPNQGSKGPLLLMHGLTKDSLAWFNLNDPQEMALGARLFYEGYQVYFGNVRGTPNSRRFRDGTDAQQDYQRYWDFTLWEHGRYDLEAMVYIAEKDFKRTNGNKCKKVSIVAHSLGTAESLLGLSVAPYANEYVS